jgi:UDP-N-acetyl-D-glucosamine dehydrogenase
MIAIVGLGYVGLPLSLQFCRKGNAILGLDTDSQNIEKLNRCERFPHHMPTTLFAEEVHVVRPRASAENRSRTDTSNSLD